MKKEMNFIDLKFFTPTEFIVDGKRFSYLSEDTDNFMVPHICYKDDNDEHFLISHKNYYAYNVIMYNDELRVRFSVLVLLDNLISKNTIEKYMKLNFNKNGESNYKVEKITIYNCNYRKISNDGFKSKGSGETITLNLKEIEYKLNVRKLSKFIISLVILLVICIDAGMYTWFYSELGVDSIKYIISSIGVSLFTIAMLIYLAIKI